MLTSIELCAGAGGQAIGAEKAGFEPLALVEIDPHACQTLRFNRPKWNVIEGDIRHFKGLPYRGVDFLCAGVPCPPFSIASKQLGENDERNLFPEALRIIAETQPQAVMLENVPGLAQLKFRGTPQKILDDFLRLGYQAKPELLNSLRLRRAPIAPMGGNRRAETQSDGAFSLAPRPAHAKRRSVRRCKTVTNFFRLWRTGSGLLSGDPQ